MPPSKLHTDPSTPTFNELVLEYSRKRPKVSVDKLLDYHPIKVAELNRRFYAKCKGVDPVTEDGRTVSRIVCDSEAAVTR